MAILGWLFARTPKAETAPPEITPTPQTLARGIEIVLGDEAIETSPPPTPEPANETGEPERHFILEPYFSMIEYTDSAGVLTRRRITMRGASERQGVFYLTAICHERRALRTFRIDRINCLISQDGEIEDAAPWFAETLALAEVELRAPQRVQKATAEAGGKADVSAYTALHREIAPAMTILIAAARSDEILHPKELDRILRYAEDEAIALRNAGTLRQMPEAEGFDKLDRTIRRLRPTQDDLAAALTELGGWSRDRKRTLAKALCDTAAADGRVDEIEAAIIEELREFGARHHGLGWDD